MMLGGRPVPARAALKLLPAHSPQASPAVQSSPQSGGEDDGGEDEVDEVAAAVERAFAQADRQSKLARQGSNSWQAIAARPAQPPPPSPGRLQDDLEQQRDARRSRPQPGTRDEEDGRITVRVDQRDAIAKGYSTRAEDDPRRSRAGTPAPRDRPAAAAIHAVFDSIDRNHDGGVSRAELIRATRTDATVRELLGLPVRRSLPPHVAIQTAGTIR